jgi:energy-coupling factor transport system substrate-specific component
MMTNQMSANTVKKGLTVKDLIIMGVFAAILTVCSTIGGIFFAITPTLTFYFSIGAALLPGPVFLLFLAKVPKKGALTIIGVIVAALSLILGMHWAMGLGGLIGSLLADIIAGMKKYRSKKMNILAYIVYSFGPTGTYFAYFIDPQAWANTMLKNGTTQDYINTMNNTADLSVLVIMIVGTILVAWLSGFVGSKLLKKQFEKAGITE